MSRAKANPVGNPTSAVEKLAADPISVEPFVVPQVPASLRESPGPEIWRKVWEGGGSFYKPDTDRTAIERYVGFLVERRAILDELDGKQTTKGSAGQTVLHPLVRRLDAIERKLLPLEDRLGRNPEARIRLGMAGEKLKTKLDEFLEEGDT